MCQRMGPPGNPIDLDPKLTALRAPFLSPTTSQLVVLLSAPTIQSDQAWNTLGSTSKGLQAASDIEPISMKCGSNLKQP
jgi:hypothetical protein